jgi:hypothetical protein
VFAGTSVPGAGVDTVMGEVISRAGDILTVRGANVIRDVDGAHFARGNAKVTIGPDTKVVKGGTIAGDVGRTRGPLRGPVDRSVRDGYAAVSSSMSGDWTLDATAGRVRMHPTPIYGFVKSASTDALTLQLDSIAGRKVSAFDFAGTGTSTAMDADPANYEVAASGLDLSGLSTGEPTKLIGFPDAVRHGAAGFHRAHRGRLPATAGHAVAHLDPGRHHRTVREPESGWPRTRSRQPGDRPAACADDRPARAEPADACRRRRASLPRPSGPTRVPRRGAGRVPHAIRPRLADFVTEQGTRLQRFDRDADSNATGSYDGDTNVMTARFDTGS